jgi:ABC-type branched-subunit amino acid transport system ATPase component
VSPPILVAKRLTAGYGKIDILHEVSLDVRPGEIVSIIGPNGAGKSTAFKTIVGVLPLSPGVGGVRGCRYHRAESRFSSSDAAWPTCRRAASYSPR